ncbi:MAG: arginine--tRNA ligase [Candidatus Woesearchaeota archaeon]
MEYFKKYVIDVLEKEIGEFDHTLIEIPKKTEYGDFSFPCFSLSKKLKKSPIEIAKELATKLDKGKYIKKIEPFNAYINFFINDCEIVKFVLNEKNYNKSLNIENKKIMIEYSSPNTNKPLHLGHLRNILLGSCISKLRKKINDEVIESSLINDRGVHICKSMLMYLKYGENKEPTKKPDHYVGDFYVMFNNELQKNPNLEKEAQDLLVKWENNDPKIIEVWKKMNNWAISGFNETYEKLNVSFDKFYYESKIYKEGKNIIKEAFNNGILVKEDGAIVADLEKYNLGKKVLLRKDETTLYMTQDIYLAKLKFDEYNLDESLYVVASEQNNHFNQLFKILELLNFDSVKKCNHLSYGMVYLPEGKMKSREGTVVDADNIIDEVINLAKTEIKNRYDDLDEQEINERSKKIGLCALKFFLLKIDPIKDMTYNPKESISFDGETGPYIQYTYARLSNIVNKANYKLDENINYDLFSYNEILLIKRLSNFQTVILQSSLNYKPSILCRYLLDLSQELNEYYHNTPILKSDYDLKNARLLLIEFSRKVIKDSLELLGIDVLDRM